MSFSKNWMSKDIDDFRIIVRISIYLMNLTYVSRSLFLKISLIWTRHKWNEIILSIVTWSIKFDFFLKVCRINLVTISTFVAKLSILSKINNLFLLCSFSNARSLNNVFEIVCSFFVRWRTFNENYERYCEARTRRRLSLLVNKKNNIICLTMLVVIKWSI